MSETTRQIGGIAETRGTNGINYEAKFLVPDTLLKKFLPAVGDRADWAPAKAYVTQVTKTFLASGIWTVVIRAHVLNSEEDLSSFGIHKNDLTDTIEQSFSLGNIYFQPEWCGCRIATSADCPPLQLIDGIYIPPDGREKYQNLDGQWAKPGDLIANNAVPLYYSPETSIQIGTLSRGSMTFDHSPFTGTIPAGWIRQNIPVRIYRCVFYSGRKITSVGSFCGVSGSFGNKCSPGGSTTGKWKARSQNVRTVSSGSGKTYIRVERTMIEAPSGLIWDASKNGGTWSW